MSLFIESLKAKLTYRKEFNEMVIAVKSIDRKEEWLEATREQRYLSQCRILTFVLIDRSLRFAEKYEQTKLLDNKRLGFEWAKNELNKFTDREKWKSQEHYEAFVLIKRMLDCFKSKPIAFWLSIEEFLIISGVFVAIIAIIQIVGAV